MHATTIDGYIEGLIRITSSYCTAVLLEVHSRQRCGILVTGAGDPAASRRKVWRERRLKSLSCMRRLPVLFVWLSEDCQATRGPADAWSGRNPEGFEGSPGPSPLRRIQALEGGPNGGAPARSAPAGCAGAVGRSRRAASSTQATSAVFAPGPPGGRGPKKDTESAAACMRTTWRGLCQASCR
jgi:hypothetical protein